jgi:hypothetical protein
MREPYVADSEVDLQNIPRQTAPPSHRLKILVWEKHRQYGVAKQFNDISTPPHNH